MITPQARTGAWPLSSACRVALLLLVTGCNEAPTEGTRPSAASQALAATPSIAPGGRIQDSVAKYPSGTTFILKAGVHRLEEVTPKSGMSFLGEPGTVLSGARLLTTFTQRGAYWVATGQTQQGQRTSTTTAGGKPICLPRIPRCTYPEELFNDDVRQREVASLGQVTSGTWFFDYDADEIYLGSNPGGHTVETSVTPRAFRSTSGNVTINGLVIEKYATPFTSGTVQADGSNWLIENNEVRYNHGIGIETGAGTVARTNHVHHNLQMGMGGAGNGAVVEDNEIAYSNNPQVIGYGWAAGGTKWHNTQNLTLRGNFVHHNKGPGLWTDIDNIYTLIEHNRVENNSRFGIYREVSYDAVIRYNTASSNGFTLPDTEPVRGGGIAIRSSSNIEIYSNTLAGNKAGIDINQNVTRAGAYGPYGVVNLYVHDNTVTMPKGLSGLTVGDGDPAFFTSKNNRFVHNTYNLGTQTRPFWWWNAATSRQDSLTIAQWQAAGQDVTGTFNRP
ncbi:MAG: right-handed parallel beta-helix repeat-containing protein [Gemmatimonadales bacterium]